MLVRGSKRLPTLQVVFNSDARPDDFFCPTRWQVLITNPPTGTIFIGLPDRGSMISSSVKTGRLSRSITLRILLTSGVNTSSSVSEPTRRNTDEQVVVFD